MSVSVITVLFTCVWMPRKLGNEKVYVYIFQILNYRVSKGGNTLMLSIHATEN